MLLINIGKIALADSISSANIALIIHIANFFTKIRKS